MNKNQTLKEQLSLTYCGLSDIGLSRPNNEDVWAALPEKGFFALADGMGGHQAGEVAAATAIGFLCESMQKIQSTNCMELIIELRHAIEKANAQIYRMGSDKQSLNGMGTTLCCLIWTPETVVYAHVGDSRIYRMRKSKLELLTEDHSLSSKWNSYGKLAETCATPYPYKHVITRAVGTSQKVKPEISVAIHEPEDLYFLCTDGLSDVLSLSEIEQALNSSPNLGFACKKLIEEAKFKGSSDNITLLLVQSG